MMHCVANSLEPFFEQLTKEENNFTYFQQNSTLAHTAESSVKALWTVFNRQTISKRYFPVYKCAWIFFPRET
jgi:hypothetical protein